MSSAASSCVMHLPHTRFFVKSEDILTIICGGNQTKCAAHRVLEVKTNGRFALWEELGNEDEPPEDFLWFIMDWDDFVRWSLQDRERTSYRTVIPQIEKDGYLLCRYVKVEEVEDLAGRKTRRVLCNSKGQPYTWQKYREAAADACVKGIIMAQYRYLFKKVNQKLIEIGMPPEPSGSSDDQDENNGEREENASAGRDSELDTGQTAQEGVTSTAQPGDKMGGGNLDHNAAPRRDYSRPPCQNQQGGTNGPAVEIDNEGGEIGANSVNPPAEIDNAPDNSDKAPCQNRQDPPVKIDNKNLLLKEESVQGSPEELPVAPGGAGGDRCIDSCFTEGANAPESPEERLWTIEGVLNQAAIYLARLPEHIRQEQQDKNNERWNDAAQRLHRALYFAQIPEAERPAEMADLLCYLTDAASPCAYRRYVDQQLAPRPFVPRLWHLADNLDCIAKDRDSHPEWRPDHGHSEALPLVISSRRGNTEPLPDADPEPTMTPELEGPSSAPPGGDPPEESAPLFSLKEANALAARIEYEQRWLVQRRYEHGVFVGLDVGFAPGQPGQWATIYGPDGYDELLDILAQDPAWAEQERRRNERLAQLAAFCHSGDIRDRAA